MGICYHIHKVKEYLQGKDLGLWLGINVLGRGIHGLVNRVGIVEHRRKDGDEDICGLWVRSVGDEYGMQIQWQQ